jgi:hypothetical protein
VGGWRTILRYVLTTFQTALYFARTRPSSVISSNPPIIPAGIAYVYSRVARVPFVIDSHPTAFGVKESRLGRVSLPVHRWLARRANAVLVTTEDWVREVRAWGGVGEVVHEAPGTWVPSSRGLSRDRRTVLYVGVFGGDEPIESVLATARSLPDVDFAVTGRTERASAELLDRAPGNVRFVGYLEGGAYRAAVAAADVVMTLTTEPTSVMRAAYEAVWAERPLVVTDWPELRTLFPHAVHARNEPAELAAAVRDTFRRYEELLAAAPGARALQLERWNQQLERLRQHLELGGAEGGRAPLADEELPAP